MMDRLSYKWMDVCWPSCWSRVMYSVWICGNCFRKMSPLNPFLIGATCTGAVNENTQLCCYLAHKDLWSLSASCFHDVLFCWVTPRRLFCSSPQSLVIRRLLLISHIEMGLFSLFVPSFSMLSPCGCCDQILEHPCMYFSTSLIGVVVGDQQKWALDWNVPPVWLRHPFVFCYNVEKFSFLHRDVDFVRVSWRCARMFCSWVWATRPSKVKSSTCARSSSSQVSGLINQYNKCTGAVH